jgi:hypothetical protein
MSKLTNYIARPFDLLHIDPENLDEKTPLFANDYSIPIFEERYFEPNPEDEDFLDFEIYDPGDGKEFNTIFIQMLTMI